MEQEPQQARAELAPATLGSLLYKDESKSRTSEQGWLRLVRAVAADDQAALLALYDRSHHFVFTLSVRIAGDKKIAEELTLEVFQDIWRGAAGYEPEQETVLGWIMNLARTRALQRLRSERRQP